MRKEVPCVMTIAGSDSGGGAGIEVDLKTFAALKVFGTCAITAITAQNTHGVYEIFPVPPQIVKRQIEVVFEDMSIKIAKTGMLYSREIMEAVAEAIVRYKLRVVVDPVFRAGTGDLLVREEDKEALIKRIVPIALVVTPNRFEAEEIAQMEIKNIEDMKEAAKSIANLGAKAVVVKGGHVEGEVIVDLLHHKDEFRTFTKPRAKVEPHGAGCTFSAAIAAYLARGQGIAEAVVKAEQFMQDAITFGLKVGGGRVPVNPLAYLYNEAERFQVSESVSTAVRMVEEHPEISPYIAEVGMQIAMALPHASTRLHIAAVEGRIVKFRETLRPVGPVRFGASSHLARIILTAVNHNPTMRTALNLHYHPELVTAFEKLGFVVSRFDRKLEPPHIKAVEGGTLVWGIEEAIKAVGKVPDVIYDLGEVGREPMIRVLGTSAVDVVEKVLASLRTTERK